MRLQLALNMKDLDRAIDYYSTYGNISCISRFSSKLQSTIHPLLMN